jgi:hypothetical protein
MSGTGYEWVAILRQFGYVIAILRRLNMRHLTVSAAILIAGILPAAAQQGQLPRPGQQPPPPQAQKGLPPGPGAQSPGAQSPGAQSPQATPQQKGAPPPQQKGAPQQQAQQPPAPQPMPYTALPITPPKPYTDPGLAAFRKELTAIAQKKDRAALAKLVIAKDFFWMKEEGNAAGKKTGIEALATALSLAAKDGSGWETLAAFAEDETAQGLPDRPNTVCSPAGPEFKIEDLEKLAETTKTDVGDWGFTSAPDIEVRASAQANAPVIEKLGLAFVWVIPDTAPNASQEFMRVVAPSGKVGFVAAETINPLGSDQLCYGKDAAGAWKIVGMIGGE